MLRIFSLSCLLAIQVIAMQQGRPPPPQPGGQPPNLPPPPALLQPGIQQPYADIPGWSPAGGLSASWEQAEQLPGGPAGQTRTPAENLRAALNPVWPSDVLSQANPAVKIGAAGTLQRSLIYHRTRAHEFLIYALIERRRADSAWDLIYFSSNTRLRLTQEQLSQTQSKMHLVHDRFRHLRESFESLDRYAENAIMHAAGVQSTAYLDSSIASSQ